MDTPPNKKSLLLKISEELFFFIALIIIAPGFVGAGILFYFSIILIYEEIYLWFKFAISIDVNTYYCLTTNPKYCQNILSSFPFDLIPQDFIRWLANPSDWLGIHSIIVSILQIVPIWLLGFISAFVVFFGWLFILMALFWIIMQFIRLVMVIIKAITKV